jgi:hypothetical protein
VYVHPWPWFTVNALPPALTVPVLAAPVLGATLSCTVPVPLPVPPAVIVIQESGVEADHAQPADDCTSNDVGPPPFGTVALAGAIVNEQPCP